MNRARQKYLKKNVVAIKWNENELPQCCQSVPVPSIIPEQEAVQKAQVLKAKAEAVFPPNDTGTLTLPKDTAVYQAVKAVRGARQADYGSPEDDFARATGALAAMGYGRLDAHGDFIPLQATDQPIIMMIVKISRELNRHKTDNVVDIIGYADTLDMVYRARERKDRNHLQDNGENFLQVEGEEE